MVEFENRNSPSVSLYVKFTHISNRYTMLLSHQNYSIFKHPIVRTQHAIHVHVHTFRNRIFLHVHVHTRPKLNSQLITSPTHAHTLDSKQPISNVLSDQAHGTGTCTCTCMCTWASIVAQVRSVKLSKPTVHVSKPFVSSKFREYDHGV